MNNNEITFELFKAVQQAQPDVDRIDFDKLDHAIKITDFIKSFQHRPLNSMVTAEDKFSKLSNLVYQLADRIVLMNEGVPSYQVLGRHYNSCLKLLYVAETLHNLTYNKAALFTAELVIKKASKFFFLHVVFQAARLVYVINNKNGNTYEERKAVSLFKKYLNFYTIEKNIEIDRNSIFSHYTSTQSTSQKVTELCNEAIDKYSIYENNIPSFYFHTHFYLFRHVKYTNERNHLAVFNNAQTALNWFDNLPFKYLPGVLIYTYVLIIYAIQKKQFIKCQFYIDNSLTKVNFRSVHWYRIKENEILMNFHRGSYSKIANIFYDGYRSESFLKISALDQERWQLYEAYVRIIHEAELAEYHQSKTHYSINKFLNSLPRFSKDKRAMNIPLLIAQMSFLIIRRKYNAAAEKITALEKYSKRYLKKNDDTFRSNCFIKMLLEIPKQGFNKTAVERHAKKYFDKLINSEIELIDQPFEIEIIPYERLWEIIMDNLSRKKRYAVGGGK